MFSKASRGSRRDCLLASSDRLWRKIGESAGSPG
jgi:hypothetical protein